MLPNKDTTILSEIKDFFTASEKAMNTIFTFLHSLKFLDTKYGFPSAESPKYSNHNKLLFLILFPFFQVKSACTYSDSALHRFLSCGKDVFYRLINSCSIDWRGLAYSINMQLLRKVQIKSEPSDSGPRCLIVDDTDLPKTGRKMELVGRTYSHVTHTFRLGFKGLFMGLHDGKSFFSLDFSIHGEKGKNKKKPYGLTPGQAKGRYSKKRAKGSKGAERVNDYSLTKIASMIQMVRLAISKGVRFDYLLVDSWFTCFELVSFVVTRRIKCHLVGMVKMGKTRYGFQGKELTSSEIVDCLRRKRKVQRSKLLGLYYVEAIVNFKGIDVKLFFSKSSKKGKWTGIMTTHKELTFEQTYKIYSTRWSIEVFFKEGKQYLGLGKCQSQDFDAQIAATTLCMLQYNLLSVVKRFNDYETLGVLFREAQKDSLKITIAEQIWLIIIEIAAKIAEILEVDTELLMQKLVTEDDVLTKYINIKPLSQAS